MQVPGTTGPTQARLQPQLAESGYPAPRMCCRRCGWRFGSGQRLGPGGVLEQGRRPEHRPVGAVQESWMEEVPTPDATDTKPMGAALDDKLHDPSGDFGNTPISCVVMETEPVIPL